MECREGAAARYYWAAGQPGAAVPTSFVMASQRDSSQAFLDAVGAVLRGADEHFYEVVVEGVVELALEAPFELRVVEVTGVEIEVVGVHGDAFVFELDDDLYGFAFGPGGEGQQWVFVEPELG